MKLPEPFIKAPNGTTIPYTEARTLLEDGEFSTWLEQHDPENTEEFCINGDEWFGLSEADEQLSDDQWDADEE